MWMPEAWREKQSVPFYMALAIPRNSSPVEVDAGSSLNYIDTKEAAFASSQPKSSCIRPVSVVLWWLFDNLFVSGISELFFNPPVWSLPSAVHSQDPTLASTSRFLGQQGFIWYKFLISIYFVFWCIWWPLVEEIYDGYKFVTYWTFYMAALREYHYLLSVSGGIDRSAVYGIFATFDHVYPKVQDSTAVKSLMPCRSIQVMVNLSPGFMTFGTDPHILSWLLYCGALSSYSPLQISSFQQVRRTGHRQDHLSVLCLTTLCDSQRRWRAVNILCRRSADTLCGFKYSRGTWPVYRHSLSWRYTGYSWWVLHHFGAGLSETRSYVCWGSEHFPRTAERISVTIGASNPRVLGTHRELYMLCILC